MAKTTTPQESTKGTTTKNIPWRITAFVIGVLGITAARQRPDLVEKSLDIIQSPLAKLPVVLYRDSTKSNEEAILQLREQYAAQCPAHKYQAHIFSTDPLIIYLEDYLSREETRYLIDLAEPRFIQSPVSKGYNLDEHDTTIRSSQSAVLPRDPVVACIEQRSMDFQGFSSLNRLEDLQVVKYGISDQFRPHFDWFGGMENPRVSTIFAYLECDNCVGGATQFPHYTGRFPAAWCRFIDCEDNEDNREAGGVGFKPIAGNAVFWRNLYENGTGHPGVWHAGMPVREGRKYGMNIMTRMHTAHQPVDSSQGESS